MHETINEAPPTLFPYQVEGARWLLTKTHALLADEMGLGKSAQALTAIKTLGAKSTLILCPASVRDNWANEFEIFCPEIKPVVIYTKTEAASNINPHIICSYDLAPFLGNAFYDVLVLDESHFLKSPMAKRTRAIYGRSGIIRRAKRTYCLSGTPAPNEPSELWSMLFTFGITTLSFDRFVERFCTFFESGHGRQITGAKRDRIPELKKLLSGVMLRRRKEDVLKQLPKIFFSNVVVERGPPIDLEVEESFVQYIFPVDRRKELEAKLKREYNAIENLLSTLPPKGFNTPTALEMFATSVSTIRRYNGIQKVKGVADMVIAELEAKAYDKVVIFAVHQGVIEGLRASLVKYKPVTLYGKTPPKKKIANIRKFMNNPKCKVFVGNIQAAGTGINLTAAHNVIFAEQDWVPGNNAQAAMRCHRIGQTKPVTVRFVGIANSIDDKVARILKRKTQDITLIFDKERLPIFQNRTTDFDEANPKIETINDLIGEKTK